MNYQDDEIENFRRKPFDFFALNGDTQFEILERLYGPSESFIFDPSSWSLSSCTHTDDDRALKRYTTEEFLRITGALAPHLSIGAWTYAGMFMTFFGMDTHHFTRISDPHHFRSFRKVFPLGCFGLSECSRDSNSEEWVYGHPGPNIIKQAIEMEYFEYEEFGFVCDAFRKTTYSTDEAYRIIKFIMIDIDIYREIPFIPGRIRRIFEIMSQKRFSEVCGPTMIYPFAQLIDARFEFGLIDPKFECDRPRWTRRSHKELTCDRLNTEFKTVLLMQKFRYVQFPLHRDLIDTVLKHLFNSYYEDLRDRIRNRNSRVREVQSLPHQEALEFVLDYGIVEVTPENIIDAVNRSMGIPLRKEVGDNHAVKLEMAILAHTDDNISSHAGVSEAEYDTFRDSILSEELLEYCEAHILGGFKDVILGKIQLVVSGDIGGPKHISHVVL